MTIDVSWVGGKGNFQIVVDDNLPLDCLEHFEDVANEVTEYLSSYLMNMEALAEARQGDIALSKVILAQNLKARIFMEEAHRNLNLVSEVAQGNLTAADLGFPEFDQD